MSWQPLSEFSENSLRAVRVLLCDIDDTITTEGRLTPPAYEAMARLQSVGIKVIPITGRPAGWCDHIARMWPVDGIVGENGAFYFHFGAKNRTFNKRFYANPEIRKENRARLNTVAEEILRKVPGTAMASDQLYREADIAIDFCEDVTPLSDDAINQIVQLMEAGGLTAKVSSIHVNGWIGEYDKLTMTKILMQEIFDCDIEANKADFAFVGDSPNDQPMFSYFPNSVGVANVRAFESQLQQKPAYVTELGAGAGFVELADALISARTSPTV